MKLFSVTSFLVGLSAAHTLAESEFRAIQRAFRLPSSLSPTAQPILPPTALPIEATQDFVPWSGGVRRRSEEGEDKCTAIGLELFFDPKLKQCTGGNSGRCTSSTMTDPAWLKNFCEANCSTWLAEKYQQLFDHGCMGGDECNESESKNACGECSNKCSDDSDCCDDARCAAGPNDIKICVDKEDDPKICDPSYSQATLEDIVGLFSSNAVCAADDSGYCFAKGDLTNLLASIAGAIPDGKACEVFTGEHTGCCGPTMFQYVKEFAPSRSEFMKDAKEHYSGCLDILENDDNFCPQVDMSKFNWTSDAHQTGRFVAMSVALATAIAAWNM